MCLVESAATKSGKVEDRKTGFCGRKDIKDIF